MSQFNTLPTSLLETRSHEYHEHSCVSSCGRKHLVSRRSGGESQHGTEQNDKDRQQCQLRTWVRLLDLNKPQKPNSADNENGGENQNAVGNPICRYISRAYSLSRDSRSFGPGHAYQPENVKVGCYVAYPAPFENQFDP